MRTDRRSSGEELAQDADVLLARGARALEVDGDLRAGQNWFDAAYREGERLGDVRVMAEAALGAAGWWLAERRTVTESRLARARLRHVLTVLAPDSVLASRVRVRVAIEEADWTGRPSDVLSVVDEVRGWSDPIARAEALRVAHHALRGPDHNRVRRELADELVGEAGRGGGRGHLLMGLLYQTVDLFLAGDPHAHRRLAELRAELGNDEHLAVGYVTSAIEVMLTIRAGRLAEAEQLARECYELGMRVGDVNAAAWYGAHIGAIRWYQGRLTELLPMLAEVAHTPELSAMDNSFVAAHAVAAAATGDHETAKQLMASVLFPTLSDVPRSSTWLLVMYSFVEAANLIGSAEAAAKLYQVLEPYRRQPIMAAIGVACFGSVEHALGVAALTSGEVDRAVEHLTSAVRHNLALGHSPAVLYSRLRLAEALERRGEPGDEAAAAVARDRAAAQSATLQSAANAETRATCGRHGRKWRVELGGRVVYVQHSVGMLHLAVLITNPGAEIAALELVAGVDRLPQAVRSMAEQAVLDRTATHQYRRRLTELPETSPDRAWLQAELATNTRRGGRPRNFADNSERARLAVGRAIRRAITAIDQSDQVIGAHLRGCVHTGVRCWYRPITGNTPAAKRGHVVGS
jgi:hypothetical protein